LADRVLAMDLNARETFEVTSLHDGCFFVFVTTHPQWVSVIGTVCFFHMWNSNFPV